MTIKQIQFEPGDRPVFVLGEGVDVEVRKRRPLYLCLVVLYVCMFFAVCWLLQDQDFSINEQTI